jgi:hypothetical protein
LIASPGYLQSSFMHCGQELQERWAFHTGDPANDRNVAERGMFCRRGFGMDPILMAMLERSGFQPQA